MQAYGYAGSLAGLPDPEMDRQFYEGVPARRLAAWMIDLLITLLVGVPAAVMFGLMTLGFGFALFPFLVATVGFVYRVATIAGGSATWGMRAMGIELRRADGSRFDFATAIMHTALYTISFGVVVLQIVSCVSMVASRYGQGLPDVILRTTAINRPAD
ncbi:RDD family protein [uncultured Amaricoccus sp.]|uniref:RDD family protein n=1 Tax=uncultured Amaricoccus sp. TaxID=339341 RepID=UPI002619FA58|nr:RDD family protein [uncultured Amaricoccus sp.]